jgi:predicted RNA-binding Zn ribbon-like protein
LERFGPTRRGGPVFRWLGEDLSLDLVNTVMLVREGGETVDLLAEEAQLQRWLELEGERLGAVGLAIDGQGITELFELREAVRNLFTARAEGERLPAASVTRLNAASAQEPHSPQLNIREDGVAEQSESAVTDVGGLLGATARAAIRLLSESRGAELHLCRAPSCGMFFLGHRRWCCAACGNRARAARHYRRHQVRPDPAPHRLST